MSEPVLGSWHAIVRDATGEIRLLCGPFSSRKECLSYVGNILPYGENDKWVRYTTAAAAAASGPIGAPVSKRDGWVIECCRTKRYKEVLDREWHP